MPGKWAVKECQESAADFADCLHTALAHNAVEQLLWTFDKAASRLAGAAQLS